MCGIFGYVGPEDSAKMCLSGLKKLEYRGYDSAGVAGVREGKLLFCKRVGKVHNLEEACSTSEEFQLPLDLAIAHTRWATHGEPSENNSHPQFDQDLKIAVVHNGIIENHHSLREMLRQEGRLFSSATDTEVIAQLIAHFYKGDFLEAVSAALGKLSGFWGLAIIHKDHPNMMIAAARENPIAIARNGIRKESFISSDPNALKAADLDICYLKNDEIAVVTAGDVQVFNSLQVPVQKELLKLETSLEECSKEGFDHFMLKEIFEQPTTIQQALHSRFLEEFGTIDFELLSFSPQELQAVKRILILACGTSWHAGCAAASLLEEKARIPTETQIASEFRYKNPIISEDTLIIAISQSGETLDTIGAVREVQRKGAKVLAVCNVRNSTLAREADGVLFLRAGPEVSVCSTKAFTSQITVLSMFALMMGRLRHIDTEEGKTFLQELKRLPLVVRAVLEKNEEIARLAAKYLSYDHFFFLGRHYMFTASLEAALKLKEISYLHATAYPAGEMKHGPIALVDPSLAVIGLCCNSRTYEKTLSNLTEVKARGAPILAVAFEGASSQIESVATDVLLIPQMCDELAIIPTSVAMQLFAYHIARLLGTNIDQPRNLAKSVTVE